MPTTGVIAQIDPPLADYLRESPDLPKPIRSAFAALDKANAEALAAHAAARKALTALRAHDGAVESGALEGPSNRDVLASAHAAAERAARAATAKAKREAVKVEGLLWTSGDALREISRATAAHEQQRLSAAWAEVEAALGVRDRALRGFRDVLPPYAQWDLVAGLANRLPLAMQDLSKVVEVGNRAVAILTGEEGDR